MDNWRASKASETLTGDVNRDSRYIIRVSFMSLTFSAGTLAGTIILCSISLLRNSSQRLVLETCYCYYWVVSFSEIWS